MSTAANRNVAGVNVPSNAALIHHCHRCHSPFFYNFDTSVECLGGHRWPSSLDFLIDYRRHLRRFRALSIYFSLLTLSWSAVALLKMDIVYAFVGLAFGFLSVLCSMQLPKEA